MNAKKDKREARNAKANEVAAGKKTRCSCGARKCAKSSKCMRCLFIDSYKFVDKYKSDSEIEWASTVCLECKRNEALTGENGVRLVMCEHCASVNRASIAKRSERLLAEKVCVSCGGKHGKLETKRLCAYCQENQEQRKLATRKIKKIEKFGDLVNKLCDDVLEIDKMHELANQIKELVARLTV